MRVRGGGAVARYEGKGRPTPGDDRHTAHVVGVSERHGDAGISVVNPRSQSFLAALNLACRKDAHVPTPIFFRQPKIRTNRSTEDQEE